MLKEEWVQLQSTKYFDLFQNDNVSCYSFYCSQTKLQRTAVLAQNKLTLCYPLSSYPCESKLLTSIPKTLPMTPATHPPDPLSVTVTPAAWDTIHLMLHWIMPPALSFFSPSVQGGGVNPPGIVCGACGLFVLHTLAHLSLLAQRGHVTYGRAQSHTIRISIDLSILCDIPRRPFAQWQLQNHWQWTSVALRAAYNDTCTWCTHCIITHSVYIIYIIYTITPLQHRFLPAATQLYLL